MLNREDRSPVVSHGFLLSVELQENSIATPDLVSSRLVDGITWIEGVGKTEIEHLGPLDLYPEQVSPAEPEMEQKIG